MPKDKDLRVWWIPQVPMKAFHVPVNSPLEAKKLMIVLADYDKFQYENNVKPDYSNVGGLQEYNAEAGEWWDWETENCRSIDDVGLVELQPKINPAAAPALLEACKAVMTKQNSDSMFRLPSNCDAVKKLDAAITLAEKEIQ